jgi:cytosine/adenosine deaminase-related metal-dependent hydrolase
MRKITANYIFTLTGKPVKNGIIVCDKQGVIIEIIEGENRHKEIAGLEQYTGVICPGFVNTHCHIELSHLKGKIEESTGLTEFLNQLFAFRNQPEDEVLQAIRQADLFIYKSGTVAVGDISNSTLSLETKVKSKLYYHTFIEAFGFAPQRASRAMDLAQTAMDLFTKHKLSCSVTPHSPYSTSIELFKRLLSQCTANQHPISLHHQESAEEDKMFKTKSGQLIQRYHNTLNIDTDFWKPTGKSTTQSILPIIPSNKSLLLIHNTFLNRQDGEWLIQNRQAENTYLVTCPNANYFIEKQLPNYDLLRETKFPICIGTDSLASNRSLSIIEELKNIQNNTNITLNELLTWACTNGAKALNISEWAGDLTPGKRPGINLITGVDLKNLQLTKNAKVKKLI